jgi:murein DD-endopeptidase MepM/ murein hydrolase activator NlpD
MKRLIIAAILLIPLTCYGYEVTAVPANPGAGEGFLLAIADKPAGNYEVLYKDTVYSPYPEADGKSEIYLPTSIEDSGAKEIKVYRVSGNKRREGKSVKVEVRKRNIKSITLGGSDEKMRDSQPMVDEQNAQILGSLRSRSGTKNWRDGFELPLPNKISTPFALHRKGKTYSYYHRGLDFSAPLGTPVKAGNSGKVILSRRDLNVYGNAIVIDHGQGILSCYFHMSELLKKDGDIVAKDEVIGKVGSSGWATGPHLHFGIYIQGVPVDPVWWVAFTKTQP